MIDIYTDGSCDVHYTKHGSSSFVVLIDGKSVYDDVKFYESTTNNRTETLAAINALSYLKHHYGSCEYTIYSDSELLVKTANIYMHNWIKKSWKNGKVRNLDLIKELYELYSFHKGSFKWVKAHNGNIWNEYCDSLCRDSDEHNIICYLANNKLE